MLALDRLTVCLCIEYQCKLIVVNSDVMYS